MGKFESHLKISYMNFSEVFCNYVNNIFDVVSNSFNVDSFLNALNNKYPSINITVEYKNNRNLTFLYLLITLINRALHIPKKKKHLPVTTFNNDQNLIISVRS